MAQHAATPVFLLLLPPPFKDSSQTLHIGFVANRGTQSVRTRARLKSPSPSKSNPPLHTVGLPSALLSLAAKVQAAGLGRPAPAPSTTESGIPALSPSAVRGRRWLSQAARPRLSPNPRKHEAKGAKFPKSPNSSAPRRGVPEACCPASLRPGRRVCDPKAEGSGRRRGRAQGAVRGRPNFRNSVASLLADGRARPPREVEGGRVGMVAPGGRPGQRGVSRGAGDSTLRSDTHHAPGPRGTATEPAAPTAERGAGRASSRSPPPPPPPPGQIHMGRGSRQGSPRFLLPSSSFRGPQPRAAPRSSGFSVSPPCTPSPPFLGRRPKFG